MRLTPDEVREMRRLYAESDLGSRAIDERLGYTGSQGVLRNRRWRAPAYVPPAPKRPGPKATRIAIHGEEKTAEEWAADPRCEVTARTIRRRLTEGVRGRALIERRSKAGRPRG